MLDKNITKCAQYHCDQHVIKMILESTQILCTVLSLHGIKAPYKPSHQNHPCIIWAKTSLDNWFWLRNLIFALNEEYKYRYEVSRDHKSFSVAQELIVPELPQIGLLQHPQVMPEAYKVLNNPVQAYRDFYIFRKNKFATWKKRKKPWWYRVE